MTLRAKIPRIMNTYTDVYNPRGASNIKYFAFAGVAISFLLYRSIYIRSLHNMPQGYYFDPSNEYSPKVLKLD